MIPKHRTEADPNRVLPKVCILTAKVGFISCEHGMCNIMGFYHYSLMNLGK